MTSQHGKKLCQRHASIVLCLSCFFVNMFPILIFALEASDEYEIKAAYLFNLSKFVEWPAYRLPKNKSLEICLLGQDSLGADLDLIVQTQKTIQKHTVVVKRLISSAQVDSCHILFVSNSEQLRLPDIFAAVKNKPILTVGECDHFVVQGGMIQFYRLENNIRMLLDLQSIRETGLIASSRLLQVVRIIQY